MKLQGQWLEIDKCQEACGCSSLLPGDNITYVIWGYFCTKVHYSAVTTTFCQAGHLKQVLCIIFLLLRTIMLKNVRQEVVFCYLQYVVVGGRFRDLIELVFFFFSPPVFIIQRVLCGPVSKLREKMWGRDSLMFLLLLLQISHLGVKEKKGGGGEKPRQDVLEMRSPDCLTLTRDNKTEKRRKNSVGGLVFTHFSKTNRGGQFWQLFPPFCGDVMLCLQY